MANKMMKIISNNVSEFTEISKVLEDTILKMSTDIHLEYNKNPVSKNGSQLTVNLTDFARIEQLSSIPGCSLSRFSIMDEGELGMLFSIDKPSTSITYIYLIVKHNNKFSVTV